MCNTPFYIYHLIKPSSSLEIYTTTYDLSFFSPFNLFMSSRNTTDNNINKKTHYLHNSYTNERSNGVHQVDMTTNAFKAPLPQPFHLPKRQVTLWDLHDHKQQAPISQQQQDGQHLQQHPRRASESIQQLQQQKDLLSKTLFPYQPIMGIHPLVSTSKNDHNVQQQQQQQQQIFTVEPDEDPMQHLVLLPLGKTGAGKSSLLNLMMGYDEFKAKAAAKSVTDCITERTGIWSIKQSENIITVADTPGFADSMQRDEAFLGVFQDYIADLGNRLGIDAFMLVFQCDSSKNK